MRKGEKKTAQLPLWMRVLNFLFALTPRQILLVLLSGVICAGLALLLTKTMVKPIYSSTVTVAVVNERPRKQSDIENLSVSYQLAQSLAAAGKNITAAEHTIDRLDLDMTPQELLGKVRASRKTKTMLVRFYATDEDPDRAQAIVQVYSEELIKAVAESVLINHTEQVHGPSEPTAIGSNNGNTTGGGILGCLLALFFFYRKYRSGRVVRRGEDLKMFQKPLLGEVCSFRSAKGGSV
ncbi:MAG: hypothetical protein E7471_01550 [Ruminococcaceae bacterium]|nr:hypothetical protein [Oscillospiraceae bacterium]